MMRTDLQPSRLAHYCFRPSSRLVVGRLIFQYVRHSPSSGCAFFFLTLYARRRGVRDVSELLGWWWKQHCFVFRLEWLMVGLGDSA
jgi:hypothetical protein